MLFDIFKKKKKNNVFPENAKYKFRDFVRFRHRGEVSCGFIHEAFADEQGNITYTLQKGGECPVLIYNYKEEDIIGIIELNH